MTFDLILGVPAEASLKLVQRGLRARRRRVPILGVSAEALLKQRAPLDQPCRHVPTLGVFTEASLKLENLGQPRAEDPLPPSASPPRPH